MKLLALLLALPLFALPALAAESPNECIPNGSFEQDAVWRPSAGCTFETDAGSRVLRATQRYGMEWEAPGKAIGGAEYVFSVRVKAQDVPAGERLCLWTRLPDRHEPPNGPLFTEWWKGTFDWRTITLRFRMPEGITRFIIFFDSIGPWKGTTWFDDFSLRPADDRPLEIDPAAPSYGARDREPLAWIWTKPGFPWAGQNMGQEMRKPVPHEEALFRRTITVPKITAGAQAVFIGDDQAALSINGKEVGRNSSSQEIARVPLKGILKPGRNVVTFKVTNDLGPAGLLARVEWRAASGKQVLVPSNGNWQCSADGGKSWRPAAIAAAPAPAPTQFHWVYPHLKLLSYTLSYPLPADATGARLALRTPGSFRVSVDGKPLSSGAGGGQVVKLELAKLPAGSKKLEVTFEDICQPPAGQGVLQLRRGERWEEVPLSRFRGPGGKPAAAVPVVYSPRTWPVNVGSFEAAATRPAPDLNGHLEPWAKSVLRGGRKLFQVGKDDNSSAEFGDLDKAGPDVTLPLASPKAFPRGLEAKLRPEVTLHFPLAAMLPAGAALVLDVADADAIVTTVGVFANGIFCGAPQVIGYDQVPGGRMTNRAWVVTIPNELLHVGQNTLTLRILPSYYQQDPTAPINQAEEYIQALNLGDRKKNPYPTSNWVLWDTISLWSLGQPPAEAVNGRPVWMGTNLGYLFLSGTGPWKEYVLRDLCYMGLAYAGSPIRMGVWDKNQFGALTKTEPGMPEGQSVGDYEMSTLLAKGMRPFLLFEPGRGCSNWEDFKKSNEAAVVQRFGEYVDMLEIGNEVDHPNYGWNTLSLAMAWATIQKQAVCGQALKALKPAGPLQIMGEGWYHAWDTGVIDAQARKEAPNDPGWTDHLSAHDYGKSYIIPAVQYYQLYGVNPPKPIWITECGSWTADDTHIFDFDLNLRGNLSYATYVVQYLLHPYDNEMKRFSLLSDQSKDARILEKARCYRRLLHAYAMHGRPLRWAYARPAAMKDRLVLVNAVDAGKALKISFINFSHEQQDLDVSVLLPAAGTFAATRYGDGATVAEATRSVTLTATPSVRFRETLAAGETVEYLVEK